jgi:hypothetical protein
VIWIAFSAAPLPYSYPNLIPCPRRRSVAGRGWSRSSSTRTYGAWWDRVVAADAKAVVRRSAERYLRAIGSVDQADVSGLDVEDEAVHLEGRGQEGRVP